MRAANKIDGRWMSRRGYVVKSGAAGWFVDGKYGYLVAGYYDTRGVAIREAYKEIREAVKEGRRPAWLF